MNTNVDLIDVDKFKITMYPELLAMFLFTVKTREARGTPKRVIEPRIKGTLSFIVGQYDSFGAPSDSGTFLTGIKGIIQTIRILGISNKRIPNDIFDVLYNRQKKKGDITDEDIESVRVLFD